MDTSVDMSSLPVGQVMWSDRLKLEGRRAAAMALSFIALGVVDSIQQSYDYEWDSQTGSATRHPLGLEFHWASCLKGATVGAIFGGLYFCGVIGLAISAESIRKRLGGIVPSTQFLHKVVVVIAMVGFTAVMGRLWHGVLWMDVERSAADSMDRGDDLFGALSYMAVDLTRAITQPVAAFASFLLLKAYRLVPEEKTKEA